MSPPTSALLTADNPFVLFSCKHRAVPHKRPTSQFLRGHGIWQHTTRPGPTTRCSPACLSAIHLRGMCLLRLPDSTTLTLTKFTWAGRGAFRVGRANALRVGKRCKGLERRA